MIEPTTGAQSFIHERNETRKLTTPSHKDAWVAVLSSTTGMVEDRDIRDENFRKMVVFHEDSF